jgi:protein-S-isoprenylcysteine O-methyltransferase Ste14
MADTVQIFIGVLGVIGFLITTVVYAVRSKENNLSSEDAAYQMVIPNIVSLLFIAVGGDALVSNLDTESDIGIVIGSFILMTIGVAINQTFYSFHRQFYYSN